MSTTENRILLRAPVCLILALVLLIALSRCSLSNPKGAQSSLSDSSAAEVRATVNILFDAFNAHDLDGVMAVYHPVVVKMNPRQSAPRVGRQLVREIYSGLFPRLPDLRDTVHRIIVEGDRAAVEFTAFWSVRRSDGSTMHRKFRAAAFPNNRGREDH